MCKIDELSETRKGELEEIIKRGVRSREWCEAALTINPIGKWEELGFGSFIKTPSWFETRVNNILKTKPHTDIAEVKQDIEKIVEYVNQLEERIKRLENATNIR